MIDVISRLCAVTSLALALTGCSGQDQWVKDLTKTVEASGYVTLNGEPVKGASVVAAPAEGGKHAANALTDGDGYFELKAFKAKDGAVPGQYNVMVTKTIEVTADGGEMPSIDSSDPAMTTGGDHAAPASGGWKNALPKMYANPKSSGLTVDIPEGGKTDIALDLEG